MLVSLRELSLGDRNVIIVEIAGLLSLSKRLIGRASLVFGVPGRT